MATVSIGPIKAYKTTEGGPPYRQFNAEAASQTFKKGAILVKAANGRLQEASADPSGIMGIADEDGHNVSSPGATDGIHYFPVFGGTLWVANLYTSQTSALTDLGGSYGITKVGDNWTVDKSKANTSRRVIIVDFDPRDAIGDTQARVIFRFIQSFTGFSYTS